jgi:hypothetical protein
VCWTPPALSAGRLLVRSPSRVICLDVRHNAPLPASNLASQAPEPSPRFDAGWLLSHERDYPNDAPTWQEMALWFAACLALLGTAALATQMVRYAGTRLTGRRLSSGWFWLCAGALSFLGPNLFSTLLGSCLFTWPALVYAAFHATMSTCRWAEQQPHDRRARWLARLAIAALLVAVLAYFELCQAVGMFIGWSFLAGLLPAFPLTWAAVSCAGRQRHRAAVLLTLLAFTTFFWSAQVLFLWQAARATALATD